MYLLGLTKTLYYLQQKPKVPTVSTVYIFYIQGVQKNKRGLLDSEY